MIICVEKRYTIISYFMGFFLVVKKNRFTTQSLLLFFNDINIVNGVVQFYPWFNFHFPLFYTHYHTLPYTQKNKSKNKN